jgi:hypothetical protein
MRAPLLKLLAVMVSVAFAIGAADAATKKKSRVNRSAPAVTTDYDGTPIIMNGLSTRYPAGIMKDEPGPRSRPLAEPPPGEARPVRRAVGSSTYVPPPNPSPMNGGPTPQEILRGVPQINAQPQINNSFSDRVTRCNHSYTYGAGVGNNPSDRDSYVRGCAN